ncbi:MAG: hypothetical protein [Caudoviricetes sp.]|nr:MAG: hypothetical protein [Caudoviricetes sp.]
MDKMQMAHEWAKELLRNGDTSDDVTSCAWRYADAMFVEYEKRQDKSRPEVIFNSNRKVIIKDGGYYFDQANFYHYKLDGDQWLIKKLPSQGGWTKCNEPNLLFLVNID